ncbi:hypothetical protein PpBr36_04678, partial [Pyricularia pennisetigena]|uniref:hypothetical protein n=1 Tax=Pyricularia pennisetigena TaxID=1578925 RepID=UPI00115192E5
NPSCNQPSSAAPMSMAVTESTPLCATETLISKRKRRHYRTSVVPIHWQLRSLIGSGRDGIIYFATGNGNLHLQRLDTKSLETETIQLLSFSPRCLVAQNGWVCCGGETGEFVAVQVEHQNTNRRGSLPDRNSSPIPFATGRSDASMIQFPRSHLIAPMPRNKVYGKERVNCITLWFPQDYVQSHERAYKSPVAVLANNDKHVTIVDLQTMDSIDTLQYPDCVNRALISPDGQLLVAVGDDPYLYVHERMDTPETSPGDDVSMERSICSWNLVQKVHLKSQKKHDKSDHRGSFAACFSNTGSYLAVGTQYGMISIFETSALLEHGEDALRAYFPSSRPAAENASPHDPLSALGAVREMAFSPGPHDILAWSEDRGRAGVADLRSGFATRQILYLDGQDKAMEHLDIADKSVIDPRRLDPHTSRSGTVAGDLLRTPDTSDSGGQRTRQEDSYQSPLTGEETQVLEALQEHRRRREQRAAAARELMRHRYSSTTTTPYLARVGATAGAESRSAVPPPPAQLTDSEREREAERRMTRARTARGIEPRPALPPAPAQLTDSERARWESERRDALADFLISEATNRTEEPSRLGGQILNPVTRVYLQQVQQRNAREERLSRQRRGPERRPARSEEEASQGQEQEARGNDDFAGQRREQNVDAHRELVQRFLRDSEEETPSSSTTTERYWTERYRASVGMAPDSNAASRVDPGTVQSRGSTTQSDSARDPDWMAGLPITIQLPGRRSNNAARTTTGTTGTDNAAGNTRISSWGELGALYGAMSNIAVSNHQLGGSELPIYMNETTAEPRQASSNAATIASLRDHALRDHETAWFSLLRQVGMHTNRTTTRTAGDETAGLTWSNDGSTLYVGAVDGIYEFHVDIQSRKFNPSIQLR